MRARQQFAAYPEGRVPEELLQALAAPRPMRAQGPRAPLAPLLSRVPSRRRRHDVCEMRVVEPGVLPSPPAMPASGVRAPTASGVDGPLLLGAALLVCPPVGVTLLWASPRFSPDAKRSITCFAAFHWMLVAVVLVAALR